MIKMLFPNSRYCRLFSDPNMDFGPSQADFRIAPVDDLDQVHIPDPVAQELRKLRKEVNDLKKQVASLHSADSDDSGGRQAQE